MNLPGSGTGARPAAGIAVAFGAIYVIWGTTFLANALMIRGLPPLLGAGLRFLLGGLLLYVWLRFTVKPSPAAIREERTGPLRDLPWPRLLACGLLFFTLSNGLLLWSQRGVPTGIAALVTAAIPLVVLILDWAFFARKAPAMRRVLGILIGLAGVALAMLQTPAAGSSVQIWRVLALFASVIFWSAGTLVHAQGRLGAKQALPAACAEMLLGGGALIIISGCSGEWRALNLADVGAQAWWSLVYLAVIGSIVAMGCYVWLLAHVSAQQVATYALVNPLVAVLLGAWILHEPLNSAIGLALLLVLAGITLVLWNREPRAARS